MQERGGEGGGTHLCERDKEVWGTLAPPLLPRPLPISRLIKGAGAVAPKWDIPIIPAEEEVVLSAATRQTAFGVAGLIRENRGLEVVRVGLVSSVCWEVQRQSVKAHLFIYFHMHAACERHRGVNPRFHLRGHRKGDIPLTYEAHRGATAYSCVSTEDTPRKAPCRISLCALQGCGEASSGGNAGGWEDGWRPPCPLKCPVVGRRRVHLHLSARPS